MFLVFAGTVHAGTNSDGDAPNLDAAASFPDTSVNSNDTLRELVRRCKARPDDPAAKTALENRVADGLPNPLDTSLLPDLPVESTAIDAKLGTAITLRSYLPSKAVEPQREIGFSRISYIYRRASTPDQPFELLFCCVHYSDLADASLAERTGKLLLLARDTMVRNLHRAPFNDDRPFDVWLCRTGKAGGEQWRNNIYFYDLDTQRSSIEWIREIIHEYSHLALAPIGGYKEPEYWANGYIGERLVVRWIMRRADGPDLVESLWGTFSGAPNFSRLLITPAIDLYKKEGPSKQWVERTDAEGMKYLIGQVLTIDDKYGPRVLGEAMSHLPHFRDARASDMVSALMDALPASKKKVRPAGP